MDIPIHFRETGECEVISVDVEDTAGCVRRKALEAFSIQDRAGTLRLVQEDDTALPPETLMHNVNACELALVRTTLRIGEHSAEGDVITCCVSPCASVLYYATKDAVYSYTTNSGSTELWRTSIPGISTGRLEATADGRSLVSFCILVDLAEVWCIEGDTPTRLRGVSCTACALSGSTLYGVRGEGGIIRVDTSAQHVSTDGFGSFGAGVGKLFVAADERSFYGMDYKSVVVVHLGRPGKIEKQIGVLKDVAMSACGALLVAMGSSGVMYLLDPTTLTTVREVNLVDIPFVVGGAPYFIACSTTHIVVWGGMGGVSLWDVQTGLLVGRPLQERAVAALQMCPVKEGEEDMILLAEGRYLMITSVATLEEGLAQSEAKRAQHNLRAKEFKARYKEARRLRCTAS